jgi:hypothetical protein
MNRLERMEQMEELEKLVQFHYEKSMYYANWLDEEKLKLSTIGFNIGESYLITEPNIVNVKSNIEQVSEQWI